MEQKSYWKKESTPFFLIFLNGFVWGMGYSIGWSDASASFRTSSGVLQWYLSCVCIKMDMKLPNTGQNTSVLSPTVNAAASVFVPSIKMVLPEISPISKSALDISARIRFEQGAK